MASTASMSGHGRSRGTWLGVGWGRLIRGNSKANGVKLGEAADGKVTGWERLQGPGGGPGAEVRGSGENILSGQHPGKPKRSPRDREDQE